MEKSAGTELYDLIKSLSRTEKAYFKKYASKWMAEEEANYMLLFDAIDKQKEFNEDNIKKTLNNVEFVRFFSRVKNYLYQLILKSLMQYHADHSVAAEGREYVRKVEVLWAKRLYDQCRKMLNQGKKFAEENELFHILDELWRWEMRLFLDIDQTENYEKALKKIWEERNKALDHLKQINFLDGIGSRLAMIDHFMGEVPVLDFGTLYPEVLKDIKEMESVTEGHNIISVKGGEHLIMNMYYRISGQYEKCMQGERMLIEYLKKNPQNIRQNSFRYLMTVSNHIQSCIAFKQYNEAESCAQYLEEIPELLGKYCTEFIDYSFQTQYYRYKLFLHLQANEIEQAYHLANDTEKFINNSKGIVLIGKQELYNALSQVYFFKGDYKNALKWLNEIINAKSSEHRTCYRDSLILSALIQFEKGNYDLIETIINKAIRLCKQAKHNPSELKLLSVLKKEFQTSIKKTIAFNFKKVIDIKTKEEQLIPGGNLLLYSGLSTWCKNKQ